MYRVNVLSEIEGIINKINIETKKRVTASNGVGRPETLAVDWITDNVYYFDDKRRPLIKVHKESSYISRSILFLQPQFSNLRPAT